MIGAATGGPSQAAAPPPPRVCVQAQAQAQEAAVPWRQQRHPLRPAEASPSAPFSSLCLPLFVSAPPPAPVAEQPRPPTREDDERVKHLHVASCDADGWPWCKFLIDS